MAMAELMLAKGAEVDAKDNGGWTPLHWAARNNKSTVAKLLLANGADPNAKAEGGTTPLDVMPELAEIVKKLEAEAAQDNVPGGK